MKLFKLFNVGIVLGLALAAAAAHFIPLVDLHREQSIVTVRPNGGNVEMFRVNLPGDRLVAGAGSLASTVPEDLRWPETAILRDTEMEIFRLRNREARVVGLASRIAARDAEGLQIIEWTLHLPARGSLYATMAPGSDASGSRSGAVRAGTREFAGRSGSVQEHFVGAPSDATRAGHIELTTLLMASPAASSGGAER